MQASSKVSEIPYILDELEKLYGAQPLKPCSDNLRELVVTILSHRTNKADETRGFEQMWERFGSWEAIQNAPTAEVIETLSPVQFPERKAPYIQQTLAEIYKQRGEYNVDFLSEVLVDKAQAWLMSLPGVGFKTSSLLLLFCFHQPVIPVDTHVHRVSTRLGVMPVMSAEKAHLYLLTILPKDAAVLYRYHKLLLRHGQNLCTYSAPKCPRCPLKSVCTYYQQKLNPPVI